MSSAITAIATCVLAVAAIGAFVYAVRTYMAQAAELAVARDEAMRLRVPVFDTLIQPQLPESGERTFVVSMRLRSNEPLASLRLIMDDSSAAASPLGFVPGINVPPVERETQPKGWLDEIVSSVASWGSVRPNDSVIWMMHTRKDEVLADVTLLTTDDLNGRVECEGMAGEHWTVPVTFKFARDERYPRRPTRH